MVSIRARATGTTDRQLLLQLHSSRSLGSFLGRPILGASLFVHVDMSQGGFGTSFTPLRSRGAGGLRSPQFSSPQSQVRASPYAPSASKRARFGLLASDNSGGGASQPSNERPASTGAELCTLAPLELKKWQPLSSEESACSTACVEPSGWVLAANATSGQVCAWELHHAVGGQAPRPPQRAYTLAMPPPGQQGNSFASGDPAACVCLLPPHSNGLRSVVAVSGSGGVRFWADVRTQLGAPVPPVLHCLLPGGDALPPHDRAIASVALSPCELAVGTAEGRLFRIAVDARLREVQCAELSKKAGWRAAFKSVVFGGEAPPLAALRCLNLPGSSSSGSSSSSPRGMLVVTTRSLALWRNSNNTSGSSASSLNGAALDFAEEVDDFSMSCQQRLESALVSDGVPEMPPVLHDVVTSANSSACWVLAESSYHDGSGGGSGRYGKAARLSMHRVNINSNSSNRNTSAPVLEVGVPMRSGDVDLVLLELEGPTTASDADADGGGGTAASEEPAILPEWPSDVVWELVPSSSSSSSRSSSASGSSGVPCQWLLCKDKRSPASEQVLGVFELQPQVNTSNSSTSSKTRMHAWRRPNGTGFTSERFVRRFPLAKSEKAAAAGSGAARAMVSGGDDMPGPESATALAVEDRLLCAGALDPSGEMVMCSLDGRAFMQAPAAKPLVTAAATTATTAAAAPLGGDVGVSGFGAGVNSGIGSASAGAGGCVEGLVAVLAEGFRLQGVHATAGQLATCLKPIQVAMDHGNATDNDQVNEAVVRFSMSIVDAPLDGSCLVHQALHHKAEKHAKMMAFLDHFYFQKVAQHPSLLAAARYTRIALAKHKQILAAATALHQGTAKLAQQAPSAGAAASAPTQHGKPFGGVYVYGKQTVNSQASSASAGVVAVVQATLAAVATAHRGEEALRAQRLSTGLSADDLFFEAPVANLTAGLSALVHTFTGGGASGRSNGNAAAAAAAAATTAAGVAMSQSAEGRMAGFLAVAQCVGVALGAARRHFHAFVQRFDSAAPGGQHACFANGAVQALCWTGEPEVRALLLGLISNFHYHVLSHPPYRAALSSSPSPSAEATSLLPSARQELALCFRFLLLGTESLSTSTSGSAGLLRGQGSSGGSSGGGDNDETTSIPGLAPLLLCACRERGLGAASSLSGINNSNEYTEVKQVCFAPLLALVSAEAGKDVALWRAASGELEALCFSHGHLEGLYELAMQGADRFPGQDHGGGLRRLTELVNELHASSTEQPPPPPQPLEQAQALAALSLKSLRSGGGAAARAANTGGNEMRPPRPADALKLGATVAARPNDDDGEAGAAATSSRKSGTVHESSVWASALTAEVANEPYLRWLSELRRGLGLAYDPQHDQFVRAASGASGAGDAFAAVAPPSSSFQFGAPSQGKASLDASSLKAGAKVKNLAASAGSLLVVASDSTNFATRKTMASLAKLSSLAVVADIEETIASGGVHAMMQNKEQAVRKEEAKQMKAAADYELALLQVQQQLHAILPSDETSPSSADRPRSWEPPSSIVTRLVEHLEAQRHDGSDSGGLSYGDTGTLAGPHPMLRIAMLALVVLDALASQVLSPSAGDSSSGNGMHLTSDQDDSRSDPGRGGFYVGTAGGQPVLLELRVDLSAQSCSGDGATPGGSFRVGTESKWATSSTSSSSLEEGEERVILQVLPPGGAPPSTLELTWAPTSSPASAYALMNAAAGVHLARVEKRAAVRAKKLMECKRLAHELWRAVVEYDQGHAGGASAASSGGSGTSRGGGVWQELQLLADQSSGSEGGSALDRGFSGTLLFAVTSAHHAALEGGEFQATWLHLRWRGSQVPEGTNEDVAWLGSSICVEDLGMESTSPGAPSVPLLKKCLDSATRAE